MTNAMSRRARWGHRAREPSCSPSAAMLGVLCLVWAAGVVAPFGVKPLVLTSGSMQPAIATGDLALPPPLRSRRTW